MDRKCTKCGVLSAGYFCESCGEPLFENSQEPAETSAPPSVVPDAARPPVFPAATRPFEMASPGLRDASSAAPAASLDEPPVAAPRPLPGAYLPAESPPEHEAYGAMPTSPPYRAPGVPGAPGLAPGIAPPAAGVGQGSGGAVPPPPIASKKQGVKWQAVVAIVIAVVLLSGGVAVYMARQAPKLLVEPPSGWSEDAGGIRDEIADEVADSETGLSLDHVYTGAAPGDVIAIVHGPLSDAPPETTDISEMNAWIADNEMMLDDLISSFNIGGLGSTSGASDVSAFRLKSGPVGIRLSTEFSISGYVMTLDGMSITRGSAVYMIYIFKMGSGPAEAEFEHMRDNIRFE
ncbi:MAG: hypothetical protein ACYC55_09515 [Candidatus Geothermincolia bacterium]